jgi:hypothetical protein
MPEISTDLHTAQEQKIVLGSKIPDQEAVPALIVLSDHHPIQAEPLGFLNERNGVQITISRVPTRMDM